MHEKFQFHPAATRTLPSADCRILIGQFNCTRDNNVKNETTLPIFPLRSQNVCSKSAIGPLRKNGSITTNRIVKAQLLPSVSISQFTADNKVCQPADTNKLSRSLSTSVNSASRELFVGQCSRCFPHNLLQNMFRSAISIPLSSLLQLSFRHGYLPPNHVFENPGDSYMQN